MVRIHRIAYIALEVGNSSIRTERRRRLAELDTLLNELERLNLDERSDLPTDLASRLEARGVGSPAKKRPPELIEAVFALQRPFLRTNPTVARTHTSSRPGRTAAPGWVFV